MPAFCEANVPRQVPRFFPSNPTEFATPATASELQPRTVTGRYGVSIGFWYHDRQARGCDFGSCGVGVDTHSVSSGFVMTDGTW
jgi:hypothetical protein